MELTYRIDCRELTSRAAAHDCFARVFALPAFYGRNLDALYDVLRLSEGMTYKAAASGLPMGGAKSVIIIPKSGHQPTEAEAASSGRRTAALIANCPLMQ